MKRRQPHHRENDEEAIIRRREAIVDRALLYAHLLSILDERSKEDDQGETAPAEADQRVSQETGEEQRCAADHDTEARQSLASQVNATRVAAFNGHSW